MSEVVEPFRAPGHHFITPPEGQVLTEQTTLDISHESLIRQWQRLAEWSQAEAESAEELRHLADMTQRWRDDKEALLKNPGLAAAIHWRDEFKPTPAWAARYGYELEPALDYLQASIDEDENERRRLEEENRQRTTSLFNSQLTHGSLLTRVEDYAEARRVLAESRELDEAIPAERRHARNLLAGYVEIMGGEAEQIYEGAGAALSGGVAVSPDGASSPPPGSGAPWCCSMPPAESCCSGWRDMIRRLMILGGSGQ